MDSPYLSSSSSSASRTRTDSTFSIHLTDTGAVQKRSNSRSSRPRSISAATVGRHPELLPDQVQSRLNLGSPPSNENWSSAKHSPQPQLLQASFSPPTASQPFSQPGTIPSQPSPRPLRKESPKAHPASQGLGSGPPTTSADMASLGYLPAPHYNNMTFQDPSYDPNYQQMGSHSHIHPSSNFGFIFGSSTPPSQQSLYAPGPLHMEPIFSAAPLEPTMSHVSEPTMNSLNRAGTPYHQENYDSLDYPLAQNQIPVSRSISQSPLSQHLGPLTPPLTSGLDAVQSHMTGTPSTQASIESIRSPSLYDAHAYSSSFTAPPLQAPQPLYPASHSYSYPPPQSVSTRQQMPRTSTESQVRVLNQKPKPQCWEHGCNGREFSTFSNLLRHQREKSGTAAKSYCPKCGAEFTRTTARNGHLAHEKCSKQRRTSEGK